MTIDSIITTTIVRIITLFPDFEVFMIQLG
jgi:hypothetical protein